MIPFIKEYLFNHWQDINLGAKPVDILFIKYADRRIRDAKVGILSFLVKAVYPDKELPVLILRTPRYADNPDACAALESEYQNLRKIFGKLKDPVILNILPRPVVHACINDAPCLMIAYLTGQPLSRFMLAGDVVEKYAANSTLAIDSLLSFQKAIGCQQEVTIDRLVDRVLFDYTQIFPQKISARKGYFSLLRDNAEGMSLPIFIQHGDFHAENIFIENEKVSGIIDWEDADFVGIPGFDFFHFTRTYFEALFNYFVAKKDLKALEYLSSAEPVLSVVRAGAESYFSSLGIDLKLLPVLLALYLIQSTNMAGSARKNAQAAVTRLDILLQLMLLSLENLLLGMAVFSYGDLFKEAATAGDKRMMDICRDKIYVIQGRLRQK